MTVSLPEEEQTRWRSHVKTEAETGVLLPQAEAGPEPPGAGQSDAGSLSGAAGGTVDLPTPRLQTSGLQTESASFCCSGHWVCGDLLWPLWETNTLTTHGRFTSTQTSHERAHEMQARGGAL